jgi:Xaa-Pro dipeptidase
MSALNVDRARRTLQNEKLDALVATTFENFFYVTGFEHPLIGSTGSPCAALLLGPEASLAAIVLPRVSAGYALAFRNAPQTIHLYGELYVQRGPKDLQDEERAVLAILDDASRNAPDFHSALARAVEELGLAHARIGFDDWRVAQAMSASLERLTPLPADLAFRSIRFVKTIEEVARLRAAAAAAEAVEAELIAQITPGVAWTDLATSYRTEVTRRGASPGFLSGGAGWRSSFNYPPDRQPFRTGDLVRLDLGLDLDRYWADTGRTVAIGDPSGETTEKYRSLLSGQGAMLAATRPGVSLSSLFEIGVAEVRRSIPHYRRQHCGHAIGLRQYDGERVAPGNTTLLEEGVVINLEVPLFEIGWGGMQIEDTVVVTETGFDALTNMSRELFVSE